jgi:hypothetical protein
MSDDRHAKVSRRAYELWEQGGGEHGRHDEHWHQANQELDAASEDADAAPVIATGDELAGLPRGEIPSADGTTMTEPTAPKPARKRAAPKPKPDAPKLRKPKA